MTRSLPLLLLLLQLATCATNSYKSLYLTRFENVTWDNDRWILQSTALEPGIFESRMSLANGYIGQNLAALGPFYEVDVTDDMGNGGINGWPLFDRRQTFGTVAGFYDRQARTNGTNYAWLLQYGDESVISGLPHWAGLTLEADGSTLDATTSPDSIADFSTCMDHKQGLLSWSYTWSAGSCQLGVTYDMFVNKLYVNRAAVRVSITSLKGSCDVTVNDIFQGDAAVRTTFVDKGSAGDASIFSAVSPVGVANVTAYVYSTLGWSASSSFMNRTFVLSPSYGLGNQSSISQAVSVQLGQGETETLTKYIGIASSDSFADPAAVAKSASAAGAANGWDCEFTAHAKEWAGLLTEDSVDHYSLSSGMDGSQDIIDLQISSVTNPFHLLQNTVGTNALAQATTAKNLDVNSIAVCGLGSSCYAGLIFWDVEVWMAPGLQASHPPAARQIAEYRVQKYAQAEANILTAYQSSQNQTGKFSTGGAVYPWTSGRYGNCTGTGPCFDYEYHINGDIGLELYNYLVTTGDWEYFREHLFPVYDSVAYFYSELLTRNASTGMYSVLNATDPDEYANNKDNPGFTQVLIKTHLTQANNFRSQFGMTPNSTWASQAGEILIPVDTGADIIVEYAGMNGSVEVKQADVILIDDLLDYPNPYSLNDLDYYAGKQTLNGPGMTYSSFSIVANEISPSGCSSFTYQLQGTNPYLRPPWYQFSEQISDNYNANGGTHPAYPFLTGMGGANRVAIFGYLGLRLMVDSLDVDPSLPPQISSLEYRTIYWQGHAIKAYANQTHTTLQRTGKMLPTANATYINSAIPVTIGLQGQRLALSVNGNLTLTNRQIGSIRTIANNVAQCQMATSPQTYVAGQYPLAAVDGAISTKWQPEISNASASVIVRLLDYSVPIAGFAFNWGQEPPRSYSIQFTNDTNGFASNSAQVINVASDDNVAISTPYNAEIAVEITSYRSNSTNVTLASPVWSGRYARLTILGNQARSGNDTTGATVAEWAIIAADGSTLPAEPGIVRRWDSSYISPLSAAELTRKSPVKGRGLKARCP